MAVLRYEYAYIAWGVCTHESDRVSMSVSGMASQRDCEHDGYSVSVSVIACA